MTIFTTTDAQAAAHQLATEQQALVEDLIDLENHLGRALLASAAVTGVTLEHRADVVDGLGTLWALYETYQAAVQSVHTILARPSPPDRAALRAVEELVSGAATVELPDLIESPPRRQVTLAELRSEIRAVYSRVHGVVTAADRVWVKLSPRIERCDALLREACTHAAELDPAADQDPIMTRLAELTGRLGALRRIALTDPLRLWVNNAVDASEADGLGVECEDLHAEVHQLRELPQQAQRRLEQVATTLREIRQLAEEVSLRRERVTVKIQVPPPPQRPLDPLGGRLAGATQLYQHRHWRQLAIELPTLERAASTALQRARSELAEVDQPLRERAELRGRLDAYRAKAARLGRVEELALEQRYQRARELLWHAPCDLVLAAGAVADYQDAVNTAAVGEAAACVEGT